jgi:hypothetical protein
MSFSRRHVYRDLRPYICTYSECQSREKLYITRHDWMYHEMQMHRRQYVCGDCDEKHPTTTSMSAHLKSHHNRSFTKTQLSIVLDMCDRPVDETEKSLCLLCGTEMYLSTLQDHLAMHMEDIALFVLPKNIKDENVEGDSISNQAAKLDVWGRGNSDGSSSLDSLHFSNAGSEPDHKQTAADFQMLSNVAQQEVGFMDIDWDDSVNL